MYIFFSYDFSGQPIPVIEYTQTELDTWNAVFTQVCDLAPKHACVEYTLVFSLLQTEGIFALNKIPQLSEMSNFLKSK
jgi:phenylalanine-4-hydroxylase